MFKKLKDKLTEEVKIPSQKFTQSMQQLAQAVVSPVSSNNSTHDTISNDNFSIDGEFDDTPQSSPVKKGSTEGGVAYRGGQATALGNSFDAGSGAGFMPVDLQTDSSTPKMPFSGTLGRLRSSSVSSFASDSSFMFPVLESSGPTYNFQSDLESCSEASESVGPNINKEQLVVAYQKIQQKYHKYKGRYADLARHYRDLDRDNKNVKHVLTDSQDKALRRMAELKEQCNLEKQAKAHLEEALRSDLEEKDHLIHTLKTKIKLLRNQVDQTEVMLDENSLPEVSEANETAALKSIGPEDMDLLTGNDSGRIASSTAAVLTPEPAVNLETENALKEKLKKLESLLLKCKEDITNKRKNIKQLESDKHTANAKIEALQQQLIAIQKREEEASLSLAKNKQTIHLELESKEDEIKKLKAQLAATNNRVTELQSEITLIREDSKKELAAGKVEATKLIKAELEELLVQNKALQDRLALQESESKAHEELADTLSRLEQREVEFTSLVQARDDLEEKAKQDMQLLKQEVSELKNRLEGGPERDNMMEKLKPILKSVQELHRLHTQLKNDASNNQSENLSLVHQQNQLIQEKISTIMTDLTQEHLKVLSELNEYKKESINARESLASVSDKFVLLEQTLSTEKNGVESKMNDLENELKRAEEQIVVLQKSLDSEKSSHKLFEEESSKQVALLERELNDERSRGKDAHDNFRSVELALKSNVDELEEKLKGMVQDKANITEDYLNEKENANAIQSSSEQLQHQLEMLNQRNRESINEITSLTMLLEGKDSMVHKLEETISELETSLLAAVTERVELEESWNNQRAGLVDQISAIQSKYDEAAECIKDIKEKELTREDDSYAKIKIMQKKNEEQGKEIINLKSTLESRDSDTNETTARNAELQQKLETLDEKCQKQTSLISTLQETNEGLMQSVQKLQSDDEQKVNQIKQLEKTCAELEKTIIEKSEQSSNIAEFKQELQTKTEECTALGIKAEEARASCSKLEELFQSKTIECTGLSQEVEKLYLSQSDLTKRLQQKIEDCAKLTAEVEKLIADNYQNNSILEAKAKECENFQTKLSSFERDQLESTEELIIKREECMKLTNVINDLKKDKDEITQTLDERGTEVEKITSELESVKQELLNQSQLLHDKTKECNDLMSKFGSLAADNGRLSLQLKQKVSECEDKEDQLDNLADEMKRVEELSQELHRINDDRDANVEVLSSEASSLAQKVEELTITTQELKEREVDLLAKLQVAQDLEAEYLSMKQREEMLLAKLNQAEAFEIERKATEKDLLAKSNQIEKLEEENKTLKESGQNLADLINRAKEAEAKCEKLQGDGAGLLLRIQKAEESEVRCSLLEGELEALKKEKAELSEEVEILHAKTVSRESTSEKSLYDSKEPVVEEPCVMKRYSELTETQPSADGEDWREKYNKLLEQHQQAIQENADVVARLTEENMLAVSARKNKQKERLWDKQEALSSLADGNSNGSLGLVEKLQQQLAAAANQLKESKKLHRQEVDDLRRILLNHGSSNSHTSSRSDNLEDATELEYLRNILYEYMMGKEPMILARVIAAVVKFDSDQTSKVLQKEQQRLSLLGHLGIS